MKQLFVPLAAIALLAASPNPAASTAPGSSAPTVSVVCQRTPFFVFVSGTDRPIRARTPDATLGERFALVSGPRTTLEGVEFYETDVVVVEPGYARDAHYWLNRDCAVPSR